jgi:hypothetical protein
MIFRPFRSSCTHTCILLLLDYSDFYGGETAMFRFGLLRKQPESHVIKHSVVSVKVSSRWTSGFGWISYVIHTSCPRLGILVPVVIVTNFEELAIALLSL